MSDRTDELAAGLARVLADRTGTASTIRDLTRLSGGASRETWAFTAVAPDGAERPLVLQRERAGGNGAGGGMSAEGALLRAAAATGVPVAPLVATDEGRDELGAPFIVMDRVDGETIVRRILRDDRFAAARSSLAREAGAALAAVHRIDPDAIEGLHEEDQVEQFRNLIDALGEPHPAFELGLRWLDRNRPATHRRGVVHGDFRMGNLIVGEDGLRAVLDWELSHLGDPVEDLGWFCVRAWRFGSPLRAGGVGTAEDLVEGYVAAGGAPVAPEDLRWWEAMGTLKWGVICIVQAATHLGGATRSVELAAIGRRTAENEEDVLELIAGPSDYEPALASLPSREVATGPHDRPTAAELLDAVGEYLVEVRDGVEGRLGFHARVAGNVVATVRRELELGPAQAAAHSQRLAALGVSDDVELAAAIRSGAVDDRLDEVTAAVRESVRDKLAVANPGYWERP
ncbi:phosphotransferase family protein [Dermatobacter hominis]|uniref:phosphotransferase family protein n=1 Tax=Dermatobacter hominis TaxID=2884263 RepID=UPI001D120514|nr:phosphotransferase family protein [Dermatobacter hominis]UDY36136.1 phosphotransferase family protein [Dermatobacter hominis]